MPKPRGTKRNKRNNQHIRKRMAGNSLAVQWLRLRAFTAEGPGSTRELGSHKPLSSAKKSKANKKKRRAMRILFTQLRGAGKLVADDFLFFLFFGCTRS